MTTPSYPSQIQQRRLWGWATAGAVVLILGAFFAPARIWSNLLLGTFYLLTIGLGGAVFLALAYVAGAGWHVAFRRIPEAMARTLPIAGVALLLVLGVRMSQYGWHHHGDSDPGTFWFKQFWLTPTFWAARAVFYIAVWIIMILGFRTLARQPEGTAKARAAAGCVRWSALFLVLYAITFSLASVDWIMALDPMWFSTMFGVYQFAGMIQATLATIIVLGLLYSSHGGPLHGVFSDEHLHDLGKLLLGFSCFWMYIWFSQYMLIWYANIPEETSYFIARTHGPWGPVVVVSIMLNWVIPFFLLLPKPAKRSRSWMLKIAAGVLVGRWVDLYLMIFPSTGSKSPVLGIWEAAAIVCLIGTAGLLLLRSFAAKQPVPLNDPYLSESLDYHAG